MKIFAHRGVFDIYPENSYRALQSALDKKFSIETDLRFTKDGDFIIIHDDTLQRLCGGNLRVSDLTLNELENMHYRDKNGQEVSDSLISFRNYCQLFSQTPRELLTAVQIKVDSQTEKGLKKISEYFETFNLFEKAFVFDLTLQSAKKMRKINSKIKIALIISEIVFEPTIQLWHTVKNFDFDIVWAAEVKNLYSREFINEVKATGRKIYAMSPDVHKAQHILHARAYKGYQETWKDLVEWGVDGICTDLPMEFKKFMDHYKSV